MQLTHGRSDLCCSSEHEVVAIYVHIHAFQNGHVYEFIEVATVYRIAGKFQGLKFSRLSKFCFK